MVGAAVTRLETGPLSVEGLRRLIDRLPAESRLEPGTADAAEWTVRAWIAFGDLCLAFMGTAGEEVNRVLASLDAAIDDGLAQRGSPLRVQALVMAAIEGVRRGKPQAVIADLVLRAFDEMNTLLDQMRAAGFHVDPFKGETLAERAERARRYAGHVRDALTDDDLRTFEEARLRRLR